MICEPKTTEQLTCFKIKTQNGTTYVIPRNCGQPEAKCTCMLENSEVVRRVAKGQKIIATRYIDDGVRPVLLVEVG